MSLKNISVHDFLERVKSNFHEAGGTRRYTNEESPLRAELFNIEQLEQHGRYLANAHLVTKGKGSDKLLKRLAANEKLLIDVRNMLTESVQADRMIAPAGEWLLDNFYLIEDHIRTGKRHLPKGYSESLPRLTNGVSAGLPRVYDIASDLIAHSDGKIDADRLTHFISAYQEVTYLQLGELWAIPIMLRLALIENLRRVAARIATDRINRNLAEFWAKQMVDTAEKDPKNLILIIADMARSGPPMDSSYVAELIRQLMWKGPGLTLPLTWMEQRLAESGLTSNELVNQENQKQAADQVSIANSIGSLRFLGSMEWRDFVEQMSIVEQILRQDASGIYPAMDFATRDNYRHAVERMAKYSRRPENEVAELVVSLTKKTLPRTSEKTELISHTTDDERVDTSKHIGEYLIGNHRRETEKLIKTNLPWQDRLLESLKRHPFSFYAGCILIITLALAGYLFARGYGSAVNKWLLVLTAVAALFAASHFATAVVNWIITIIVKPEPLSRMDFSKGIPDEFKTLVVVPAMLVNENHIDRLAETLEIRFLANRDKNLSFGLLTDFLDANAENLPGDARLVETVRKKIEELNNKYNNARFFLFHRPRKWNPYDKIWMGYERKRGKLSELNALLRRSAREYFSVIEGDLSALENTRYIITLDTDTQLPRDTAWRMVGTMAHPLNQPFYDKKKTRITKGYGILQPRVSVSLARDSQTVYARIHGSEPGIDPYTRLTSDVYQDLFGEGSFIGKGIYDIDAFDLALGDRFPENRILSHDLLEGCYTRAGLLSDVELYEDYPPHYSSDVNRRHRWIRGDWQIAYWALPAAPDRNHRLRKNPLSGLARWKIFDNLRRSIVPVALTLLLLLGWTTLHAAWFWTLAVAVIVMLPSLIVSGWNLFRKSKELNLLQHIALSFSSMADSFLQHAFLFSCLPYEAYYSLDAIARTSWRMLVTHKKLLEWNPASHQEHTSDRTLKSAFSAMWPGPTLAVLTFIYLVIYTPVTLVVATPVLILWAGSPVIAWWISRSRPKHDIQLSQAQLVFLRKLSRKTWAFFETFVNSAENWLPPDNYQEIPNGAIAHRTSPTNIGLSLLANLTAYDFGFITAGTLLERTRSTFDTLTLMERYRGHLYNWYDTITLRPLAPKYVSTVDSGNMAGHLLVLRQGLLSLPDQKTARPESLEGLRDTVNILLEKAPANVKINEISRTIENAIRETQANNRLIIDHISKLGDQIGELTAEITDSTDQELNRWVQSLAAQCKSIHEEISLLQPSVCRLAVPKAFTALADRIKWSTLRQVAENKRFIAEIDTLFTPDNAADELSWLQQVKAAITHTASRAEARIKEIEELAELCLNYADIEFEFLYDRSKHLLTIGYNAEDHRKDAGDYDLLASEASLCTFVGISQGKLSQESWFALGRLLTETGGSPTLLSWSGSMFEYLMPLLVMPTYENTLIDETHKNAVARQIAYGAERNIPWGISESGYYMVDASLNYQYRAFGVPGLGLKRGLAEDLVIAPYATALALMVSPAEACKNLERMSSLGFQGRYGFYEAIDYTASRLPRGQSFAIVQSYMAHHQGMSLLSLAYLLLGQPMQKRFESELQFQASMLLLQERIPKTTSYYTHATDIAAAVSASSGTTEMRVIHTPHTPVPDIQLLSNGRYHVMVTNAGGGYSRWKGLAVTRWREDTTCDNWGTFCYIRDVDSGVFWSNTWQPTLKPAQQYEVTYMQGKAEIKRTDNKIETYTEIVVSPEDDIEMRRVHITNRSRKRKTIEITTYAEVVLAPPAADASHPAFSNLFIQSEIIESKHAILCARRPRSVNEHIPSMFHLVTVHGAGVEQESFETDRMQFIGRGNTPANPACMNRSAGPLSNSQGSVLDPIVSVRYQLALEAEETAVVDIITGIGANRDACLSLIEKYQDKSHKDRVFELAWTHSQVVLRQINATEADAQLFCQLAASIIYVNPAHRADPSILLKNRKGQSGLWGYSISGDLPMVLLQIENQANIDMARFMVQAHTYWRLKGLPADLIIWNEDYGGYRQDLQNQIMSLVSAGNISELTESPGGIFVRAADQVANEDRILMMAAARVNLSDKKGAMEEQINRRLTPKNIPYLTPQQTFTWPQTTVAIPKGLVYFNGHGGFSSDGKEYVIISGQHNRTPLPWVNVLANPQFGTVVSESGQSYTWIDNAHEYRLTPWENDAVCDRAGEVFYIRDEESGYFWSPMPLPAGGVSTYVTRHGFGYSTFEHSENGINTEMQVFVDTEEPVKFYMLRIRNNSHGAHRMSVTGYVEWILGDIVQKTGLHIITETDGDTGAIIARNQYNKEFEHYVAFFDTDEPTRTITCDRTEFLGRNGNARYPDAMLRSRLSGKVGPALDPCGAIQATFTLADGQEKIIVFRLGAAKHNDDVSRLIHKFRGTAIAFDTLQKVRNYWSHTLNAFNVNTPDPSVNILANGWLMYQTIACRLWARSGYYQSGGAFGFRDQLQDILAVTLTFPDLARRQILLCASRQFKQGDVQHWWHPPAGRGVRTRCSDDLLWLPYATAQYVSKTADVRILDEIVPFQEGRLLTAEEHSYYDLPIRSDKSANLYAHCVAAIRRSLVFGEHGLPLMGSGDWNDGMDLVGGEGKGESVWLAFFLYDVLQRFANVSRAYGDEVFAETCVGEAERLRNNIEEHAWDGNWYRRAYFDDGTPLGSSGNAECQIDSISQSWAILSGAGDPKRTRTALASADKRLVREDAMLIQLLDPPFDTSELNPGYIKGYVPGIRENGGQYTHAAVWMIMAHAASGNARRAWELMTMINPLNHGNSPESIAVYKAEPYVVAADVYSVSQNRGRGGWTWYTGSAGWMYQLIFEWLLGIKLEGGKMHFKPCMPQEWTRYEVDYRYHNTVYNILVHQNTNENGTISITLDGIPQEDNMIMLVDDNSKHNVEVKIALPEQVSTR